MSRLNYYSYNIKDHNWIIFHRTPEVDKDYSFWKYLYVNLKKAIHYNLVWVKRSIKKNIKGYKWLNNYAVPHTNSVIFIAPTLNNTRSLRPIWSQCNPAEYTVIDNSNHYSFYPEDQLLRYIFRYILPLLKLYISSSKKDKKLARLNLDQLFPTMGLLKLTETIILQNDVKLIVMANDHSPLQRGFLSVAKEYGIPTMYIQHATVTDKFPPLQFSYSFLDGTESFEKYAKIGNINGHVYAIGSPRFDEVYQYRNRLSSSDALGIAVSRVDNIEETLKVVSRMFETGFENIIFRPHPNILTDENWNEFTGKVISLYNVKISNPQKESPFEYLSQLRCLISGESGLHLDSLLMGVPSVCYNFNLGRVFDLYGYIQDGMLPYEDSIDGLLNEVSNIYKTGAGVDIMMARRYNAAFMTRYEGQISRCIALLIQKISADCPFSLEDSMHLISRSYENQNYYTFPY